jgi:hypothetical protein
VPASKSLPADSSTKVARLHLEAVLEREGRARGRRCVQAIHLPIQEPVADREFQVVIIRKIPCLVQVGVGAVDLVGYGPPAAGHQIQIHHILLKKPLVVVNVSGYHNESCAGCARGLTEIVPESNLVGPRIVIDAQSRLNVGDRRVV